MNKRICHCTSVHPVFDTRIFFKECCSLAKAGYEVYLVAPNARDEVKNGVHIVGVNVGAGGRLKRILSVDNKVFKKALSLEADVYHFHDPELLRYALKLKKKGKKVIFDSHEDVASQILQKRYLSVSRYFISWLYKKYEKYVLSKVDAVISVTPHIVDKLRTVNENTYLITNYPLLDDLQDCKRIERLNNKIVFAGGVSSLWLHENVLKALEYVPEDVTYVFAGSGSEDYINSLKWIEGWKRTEYLGTISRQKVLQLYRGALLEIGRAHV